MPGSLSAWLVSLWLVLSNVLGAAGHEANEPAALAMTDLRAVRAELRAELGTLAATLSEYTIDVVLDPGNHQLIGRQTITYRNGTGQPLDELYLRLYPNAEYYAEGALTIEQLHVGGRLVPTADLEWSATDTVLRLPLEQALPPSDAVGITLDFVTTVPVDATGGFGIFSHNQAHGSWVLADWYPIMAGFDPARGWRLDPPIDADPTFAEPALYDVTITAPATSILTGTGALVDQALDSEANRSRFHAGPARNFSLLIDDAEHILTQTTMETELRVPSDESIDRVARVALDDSAESMAVLDEILTPYPFTELDLGITPLQVLGVTWSGMIFLDELTLLGGTSDSTNFTTFLIAHEVSHQWWGEIVGIDTNDHTFLAEGLANYLAIVCLERMRGAEVADLVLRTQIADPYLRLLNAQGDGIADLPITEATPGRSTLVYSKAALGFLAIRQAIGDEAFLAGLASYADEFSWRYSTPADLRSALEAASGQELISLWRTWFEAAETTPADVEALLAA